MAETYDLILKGGTVVNQDGEGVRDIGVRAGKIAAIGALSGSAGETVDCHGLHILPGVIDTQVHFREPGMEHKEDLATGSLSAVMGGVSGLVLGISKTPVTVTREAFADKIARATGRMHCDFAFYAGGTHDNVAELREFER